jgi:glucose-6-phosphate dehydrogenase assembly protein OpcA
MYGALGEHADSVVTPLLMPDTPVVTWWPGTPPDIPFRSPLGALAQRRITDAAAASEPRHCLETLARGYRPGDTDLSWTRATSWRTLLAATLDQPHGTIMGGAVAAEQGNPSADLIASWLSTRLAVPFETEVSAGPGITGVTFTTADGDISLTRPDGRVALLRRPDQPERKVSLHRRETSELLSEELRRLDPDEVYAESIAPLATAPAPEPGGAKRVSGRRRGPEGAGPTAGGGTRK